MIVWQATNMRVEISLPDELFRKAEAVARCLGLS